jgi:hypothetical protein
MVIREDDAGPSQSEIIRHVLRSYIISSKPVPNKDDHLSRRRSRVLLLCFDPISQRQGKVRREAQVNQANERSSDHGFAP